MLFDYYKKEVKETLTRVIPQSPFYQRKYKSTQTSEALEFFDLPFINKIDLLEDQCEFPPFGSNLCIDRHAIQRIHKTSGTTNNSLIIAMSQSDILNTVNVGARCFKNAGLTAQDIVVNCLNYNMWAGGYTDHQSLEFTGAAVIPFGVGNTSNLINMLMQIKPTTIHCTPSYLTTLERVLKEEYGIEDPKELKIRLGLFGAESGLQNSAFRARIEEKWGLKAVNANYGLSEVLSIFASETYGQQELVFLGYDILYPEILYVNNDSTLPIEKGVEGELVLTTLYKQAQPLIRYRTGDLIRVSQSPMSDQSSSFRFEVLGRTDDMFVVKGVNVYLRAIENALNEIMQNKPYMYEIRVSQDDPIDVVELHIEQDDIIRNFEAEIFKNLITRKLRSLLFFSPDVFIYSTGSLYKEGNKHKKFVRSLV